MLFIYFASASKLNPKTGSFRWYLIDLISRFSKVPKTVSKILATPNVRFFQNIFYLWDVTSIKYQKHGTLIIWSRK